MRAVIQRVTRASVKVNGETVGQIAHGLLVLLGVGQGDTEEDARWMATKISGLRCFADDGSKFNRSLADVGGAVLAVSQFTLYGDCRRGKRPSFTDAAEPVMATRLYKQFVADLRAEDILVETGEFGAHMDVELVNDGPVTLLLDSRKAF